MKKLTLIILPVLLLAGCVTPLCTPSGNPEVIINRPIDKVRALFLEGMMSKGNQLVADTPNSFTFDCQLDGGTAVLYTVLMGNAYSSQPTQRITFNFVPLTPKSTKVYAFLGIQMTGAFGQNQGMDTTRGRAGQQVYQALLVAKQNIQLAKP